MLRAAPDRKAIPLRDGCDLLDVIGRRLQAQVLAS
jgi:hypothetical protein